jgi:hypothetical protein
MENQDRSLESIRNSYRQPSKDELAKKFLEDSKKRFIKTLETKMKTAFIGPLNEFEKQFGFLWGDSNYNSTNVAARQLKECLDNAGIDETIWLEVWNQIRERILTNGNNQLRALLTELETYTLHWNRYRMDLKVLPEGMTRQEFINRKRED